MASTTMIVLETPLLASHNLLLVGTCGQTSSLKYVGDTGNAEDCGPLIWTLRGDLYYTTNLHGCLVGSSEFKLFGTANSRNQLGLYY